MHCLLTGRWHLDSHIGEKAKQETEEMQTENNISFYFLTKKEASERLLFKVKLEKSQ
jgi:hypothetical protein